MEPIISDLGLNWLVCSNNNSKGGGGSSCQLGSKRSMGSCNTSQDLLTTNNPYVNPFSSTEPIASPYQALESLKNLNPTRSGMCAGLEDRYWALRMADVAIRAEVQGKEEDMMGIFKLGFNRVNLVLQKRPTMKKTLQILEKSPL
ncbi:hypothetical protein Ancab_028302 [Ancistrocladus abbreviatus]